MTPPWTPLFGRDTPWCEVELVIEEEATRRIEDVRAQLAAMPDLTPAQRVAGVAAAAPVIREKTHEALMAAWIDLQGERAVQ